MYNSILSSKVKTMLVLALALHFFIVSDGIFQSQHQTEIPTAEWFDVTLKQKAQVSKQISNVLLAQYNTSVMSMSVNSQLYTFNQKIIHWHNIQARKWLFDTQPSLFKPFAVPYLRSSAVSILTHPLGKQTLSGF
jgi:hypothetical protein